MTEVVKNEKPLGVTNGDIKMKNDAELWAAIYHKLQEIDENRRFRKTIDPRQVTLEEAIARAERKLKK